MKIINKFLFLLLLVFTLAGCGSFFEEETVSIESIETVELEDGSIKLIIYYTDEEMLPVELIIPKGEEGAKGNGIKDIYPKYEEELTKIIVEFTDTSQGSKEFNIPHGAEIDEILVVDKDQNEIKTDELGNDYRVNAEGVSIEEEGQFYLGTKYLKVLYTEYDLETGEQKYSMFELPQGKTGKEGNGIESVVAGRLEDDGKITEGILNDDGSITIQFKYTQSEEPQSVNIPPSKAIYDVVTSDNGSTFQIDILYTTKDEYGNFERAKPIIFKKPAQWLSGTKADDNIGNVGDYFYDLDDNIIYIKKPLADDEKGHWEFQVDLGRGQTECTVKFHGNGGFYISGINHENKSEEIDVKILSGNYFYGLKDFPEFTHPDGLVLVGWYTDTDITATTSKFTDLTIVNTDLDLYAIWQEIE